MTSTNGRIGLIGLGEAGAAIAAGLREEGADRVVAYDAALTDPVGQQRLRERARAAGATLVGSPAEVAATTEVILSLVTASVAKVVAESVAPHLRGHHVYADLNSASPRLMQEVDDVVAPSGAHFADAAVMAAVPPHRQRVPILASGPGAQQFADRGSAAGMRIEVVGDRPGQASAIKLCRSLLVKGLEALLWDVAAAADRYGASGRVFDSLADTLPGEDWADFGGYLMSRTVAHGERRAHEMDEAAAMLREAGLDAELPAAAARRLRAIAALGLAEHFDGAAPASYDVLIRTWREVTR